MQIEKFEVKHFNLLNVNNKTKRTPNHKKKEAKNYSCARWKLKMSEGEQKKEMKKYSVSNLFAADVDNSASVHSL